MRIPQSETVKAMPVHKAGVQRCHVEIWQIKISGRRVTIEESVRFVYHLTITQLDVSFQPRFLTFTPLYFPVNFNHTFEN